VGERHGRGECKRRGGDAQGGTIHKNLPLV
jgi:hypothetical protein